MRQLLRRWLGIEALERRFVNLLVEISHLSPQQAEEVAQAVGDLKKDYRLINEHGEEGKL